LQCPTITELGQTWTLALASHHAVPWQHLRTLLRWRDRARRWALASSPSPTTSSSRQVSNPHIPAAAAAPRPGARVLDLACGTGVMARLVAPRVGPTGEVVGLDLNPGMLAVAAAVASNEPATTAWIRWQEASAVKMPLPDAAFDVVYCQLG